MVLLICGMLIRRLSNMCEFTFSDYSLSGCDPYDQGSSVIPAASPVNDTPGNYMYLKTKPQSK